MRLRGKHPRREWEKESTVKIGVPKETIAGENRVAMTPESAGMLQKLGYDCLIETKAGEKAGFNDADYEAAGVKVVKTAASLWKEADIIAKVRIPTDTELKRLTKDKTLITFFNPGGNEEGLELAKSKGATVIAMEMVPRISRAQKMDALSSMANIAGYRAVIEAGNNFGRFFTGQVTAAGKVPPAKVLVIGAGVAGLAAIGTSTSLGAQTFAFDVRPEVAEQVESMGAEFVYLDFEEEQADGAATGGYAAVSSPEFREAQLAKFRELAPDMDIVITTALIPGRPAPVLITADMVKSMKPGSVIVDLASERGGNCELTEPGKVAHHHGVTLIGYTDLPSRMAKVASDLYATNLVHLITELTPEKDGQPQVNMEDDVIRGLTVVRENDVTWPPPQPEAPVSPKPAPGTEEPTAADKEAARQDAKRRSQFGKGALLLVTALALYGVGAHAPESFLQHFTVFVLSCFIGWQVIWNVTPSLHTPLMSVTNAISGIIVIGAILRLAQAENLAVGIMAFFAVLIASINVGGGFRVTHRMLKMFRK